jgi:pimeloyl-ACP methyl ester carboxylesterase
MNELTIIIVCACVAAIVVAIIIAGFCISAKVFNFMCGARQDRNSLLSYYSPEHFNLKYEEIPITYMGTQLYGAVYSLKDISGCKGLIIFSHGVGAGHCAYMTEIAQFAERGYAVLAYDNYGCDRSGGKNAKSFYSGAEAVVAAYIAVNKDNRLKDMPKFLVGHSWGAYSVLCASEHVNVNAVVAFSAFDKPSSLLLNLAFKCKVIRALLSPFMSAINCIKSCSIHGNRSAVKAIEKSHIPALLIWGEKDVVVNAKSSAALSAQGANISKLILPDKRHNPYNTVAAEDKLAELTVALTTKTQEQAKEYFANFDFDLATQEDMEVMDQAIQFIEKNI